MLKHTDIWAAIDRLASERGMTASGLARRAGLDPTTFNKSKRITREGKPRWPSTESISKILGATGASIEEFIKLLGGLGGSGRVATTLPLIGFAQAGAAGFFDDAGYPVGGGWDEIPAPEIADPHAYALEVTGDSMEPVYRDGDIILVSPGANIRRGDRVVIRTVDGEVTVKELVRQTAKRIEVVALNPAHGTRSFEIEEVAWIGRVVWVSQ